MPQKRTRPPKGRITDKAKSMMDELDSAPEGNYKIRYERHGGPKAGSKKMFKEVDKLIKRKKKKKKKK